MTQPTVPAPDGRVADQLRFLLEVDALKGVLRQTYVSDGSRRENSGEHSWHAALFALVLAEHAAEPVDASRVIAMLLVHDLVEVDAGDTFVYDEAGQATKAARELAAADRLFGLLPADQGPRLRALWEEFEAGVTADARFANAMDRLAPILLNFINDGRTWRQHGVTAGRVRARNANVGAAAPALGEVVASIIEDAMGRGWIREEAEPCP
ncbi:MAG TPA: HD domain-containing protein [Candidatus Dormibacteraeota bacterium]|jgi:putative hydrolase of HD superfamily